ncbi:MAG: hypothetical protein LH469_01080, partial [Frankiaceae bacterium]|nr:hypothetical protein [Frankiaceae bacterium]
MIATSDRALRRWAWVAPSFYVVTLAVGVPVLFAEQRRDATGTSEGIGALSDVALAVLFLVFPLTGLLILRRQPRNTIGWLLQAIGVVWGLTGVAGIYASYGLLVRPGSLPGPDVAVALTAGGWAPGLGLMGTFLLLVYPNGHLPSPRWRPVAWLSASTIVVVTVVIALFPGPLDAGPDPTLQNPLGLESARPVLIVLLSLSLPLLPACIVASAVALVRRFRRSAGVERLQLKWLAAAGTVVAFMYLTTMVASLAKGITSGAPDAQWLTVLQNVAIPSFVLLPVSIGIAVLRYRLYDIDLVINRALVYGGLTATLAGTYLASVLLLQLVLSPLTDRSDLAVAASTLGVAALFRPARARIQGAVDRRFYRRRY